MNLKCTFILFSCALFEVRDFARILPKNIEVFIKCSDTKECGKVGLCVILLAVVHVSKDAMVITSALKDQDLSSLFRRYSLFRALWCRLQIFLFLFVIKGQNLIEVEARRS